MIIEKAYAKLNLTLEVKGKRKDGYHELESLIVPIDIYDVLYFENSSIDSYEGIEIDNNNILKTVKLFKETFNISKCVKVKLEKNIPIQAGLAGGSSDSSAVLRGLNKLWELNLSNSELCKVAQNLGSDNPYCVYQRPMIMSGRGEILKSVNYHNDLPILIIKPSFGVSTKEIFNNYKASKGLKTDLNNLILFNDLEKITLNLYPELKDLYNYIKSFGFDVHMSGSGPTLFVIDNNIDALYDKLKEKNLYIKKTKFI